MKMFLASMILYYYLLSYALPTTLGVQCGEQAGGAICPGRQCCSKWGWCGTTDDYCGDGCQSNCPSPPAGGDDLRDLITKEMFEEMLLHRNDHPDCAVGFYTYEGFIEAADSFPSFANNGTIEIRKREVAAFFAQTSHETTGSWPYAPDGPYTWGYCFKEEKYDRSPHCVPISDWPCVPGKKYYGRGPFKSSFQFNYNYGPAGKAIGYDLLNDPDEVAEDVKISFETAIWLWMTPKSGKPSGHQVMTEQWNPSWADIRAGRYGGYGVVTNIINGEFECGRGYDRRVADRIGFFKRYADILEVSYGDHLDCYYQRPFGHSVNELCTDENCEKLSDV